MTRQWYQEHGFKMSSLIDETEIARAEADVTAAYVVPIVGAAIVPETVCENAIANLAFLLLLQRTTFLTRAGAKTKTGYNSQDAGDWARLQDAATSCHLALETLRAQAGVNAKANVTDICKIYFKTNFISL